MSRRSQGQVMSKRPQRRHTLETHNNTTAVRESIQISIGIPDGKATINLRRGPAAHRRRPAAAAVTAGASRRAISA